MAQDDRNVDVKGERGGDTGETKEVGKGAKAEKGDARRENRQHEGKTRPHADHNGRPGSESNAGSNE
jgi:hypothetical protein